MKRRAFFATLVGTTAPPAPAQDDERKTRWRTELLGALAAFAAAPT